MKLPEHLRIKGIEFSNLNIFHVLYKGRTLKVIASIDNDWEHVSISLTNRNPNWEEMCHVKNLFWDEEEMCIQFHPKKSEYVNAHPYCLHIWKPPIEITNLLTTKG